MIRPLHHVLGLPFVLVVAILCSSPTSTAAFSAVSPPRHGSSSHPIQEYSDFEESVSVRDGGLTDDNLIEPSSVNISTSAPEAAAAAVSSSSSTVWSPAHAAIVLNVNARSVSHELVPIAESIFGKEYVYVTTTEEEGKQAAALMMQQNISMVIPVGGDGTLSSMINFLCDAIREKNPSLSIDGAMKELPLVAYVPLGTGNGVGSVVGSELMSNSQPWKIFGKKRRRLRQVQSILKSFYDIGQELNKNPDYLHQQQAPDVVQIPMMEVSYPDSKTHDNTLCFFAGAGFDSLMLQDFQSIKKWAIRTKILTKTLSSVAGYCVALVVKTLPKCLTRQEHNIHVRLTTRDPETLWVDHRRGDVVQQVGPTQKTKDGSVAQDEALLYQGTTGILAAGTSPFYGGGLRLFPFARLTKDKMHLRLGRIHPLRGFFNIPQIFEGSFRDKRSSSFGCMDYIGGDFDIHITSKSGKATSVPPPADSHATSARQQRKGFPVQHSGESVGYFERFRLRVVKEPVRFVTLMKRRVIKEDDF